jgi:hypothetical protein
MDLNTYVSGITASITNQNQKYAITPSIVGNAFTDLANIVGTVAGANSLLGWTYSNAYALTSIVRNSNSAVVSGTTVWPDNSTGVFITDTFSTAFSGAIDAYHITYVPATGSTKTITQPLLTRDSNGAVIAQPALIIT